MKQKFYPLTLLLMVFTLVYSAAVAQPGRPNFAFGTGGLVKQRFQTQSNLYSEMITGTLRLPDGKILAAVSASNRTLLVRLTADGTIDPSYGKAGYSLDVPLSNPSLAAGTDGRIYVAGYFTTGFGLACFDEQGALVKTFGSLGMAVTYFNVTAYAQSIIVLPDGRIVLAGHTGTGPNYNLALARYNPDGTPDLSFGKDGKQTTDFGFGDYGYASALQPDGKIVVAGGISISSTGGNHMAVVRYHTNGTLDSSFGSGGRALSVQPIAQSATSVQVLQDGAILIGGGNRDFVLARFDGEGRPDTTFGTGGVATTHFATNSEVIRSLQVLDDGRILAAGDVLNTGNRYDAGLARYLPNGLPDSSFGSGGRFTVAFGYSNLLVRQVALWPGGRIAVAGGLQYAGTNRDYALFVCREDGQLDTSFGKDGLLSGFTDAEITEYRALVAQPDRKLVAGGYTNSTGDPNFALARYTERGELDPSFGTGGLVVTNFGSGEQLNALQLLPGGGILAGGVISSPAGNDFLLARYNTYGVLDITFGQGGRIISAITPYHDMLSSLALQADGRILAGGSTGTGSPALPSSQQALLARFNADGSLDSTFGKEGKLTATFGYARGATLLSIKVLPGGRILTLNRGINSNNTGQIVLACYNADGSPDSSFGKGGLSINATATNDYGQSLEVQPDGKILVGGYTYISGADQHFALLRFTADGQPDPSFGKAGQVFTSFTGRDQGQTVSVQRDGKIILAGQSYSGNNVWDLSIARYLPNGQPDTTFGTGGKVFQDMGGEDYFTRSAIIGNHLYVAGTVREFSSYGSVASFVLKEPLQIKCPPFVTVPTEPGSCKAAVKGLDPVLVSAWGDEGVHYTLSGATTGSGKGSASGLTFPKGTTKVIYAVKEDYFERTCSFSVTVVDGEAPTIALGDTAFAFCASSSGLYPLPRLEASDNCGTAALAFSVQDAAGNIIRTGKDDDASGSFGIGLNTVYWTATDESGNKSTATYLVTVHPNPTVTLPDAYALNSGVLANTVYIGYAPASSLTLQAQASGGKAPYGYSWSNGDKVAASTVNPTAPAAYTVLVTDGNGCQDSTTKYIEVQDIRAGHNGEKVALCHTLSTEPVTFTIEPVDVSDHLAHGDMLGRCPGSTRHATTHVALPEQSGTLSIQALPNPTTGYFAIRVSGDPSQKASLRVTDLLGRIVERKDNLATNHTYHVGSDYQPGVYFVEVVQGNVRKVVKLIKQGK